jgi:hypothetical protein
VTFLCFGFGAAGSKISWPSRLERSAAAMAAVQYVDKLCEKLDSVYQKQIETLNINGEQHLTWLKEIVPVVRRALLEYVSE